MNVFSVLSAESWQIKAVSSQEEQKTQEEKIVKRIRSCCKEVGVSLKGLKEIVHFVENYLLSHVESQEYYLFSKNTGLTHDIEYDPATGFVFIHEITKPILHRNKFLSKSILYNEIDPRVVFVMKGAASDTLCSEIENLRRLPISDRLPKLVGAPTHIKNGKIIYKIILPYYEGGDLKYVENKNFSTEEKLIIAMDFMEALKEVHAAGLSHGDLHGGNLLLTKNRKNRLFGVDSRVVLIDWDRGSDMEAGSILWRKDMYAAGCTLYCIFYERRHVRSLFEKLKELENLFNKVKIPSSGLIFKEINKQISERKEVLESQKESYLTVEEKLEKYVLQMMHPTYDGQQDAAYWYDKYKALLKANF
jgi:hypothetical protein